MTLHFVESAPPGRTGGRAVILLHAFPMDSALWVPQRRALAAAGHHVITPDLPGFGGSPLAQGTPSLDVFADEVARLMDHLTLETATIGGLSMGGYVTMAMLRRHPERVGGVILADTKASADTDEAAAGRRAMADSVVAAGGQDSVVAGLLGNLLGTTSHAQRPQVVATVRRWVLAQDPRAVAWAQQAMAIRPDSMPDLEAFTGPALVLVGAEDSLTPPEQAERMAQALSSGGGEASLMQVPGVGHLSAVEDPAAVSSALEAWLSR